MPGVAWHLGLGEVSVNYHNHERTIHIVRRLKIASIAIYQKSQLSSRNKQVAAAVVKSLIPTGVVCIYGELNVNRVQNLFGSVST